jgi:hypothetical protein
VVHASPKQAYFDVLNVNYFGTFVTNVPSMNTPTIDVANAKRKHTKLLWTLNDFALLIGMFK